MAMVVAPLMFKSPFVKEFSVLVMGSSSSFGSRDEALL